LNEAASSQLQKALTCPATAVVFAWETGVFDGLGLASHTLIRSEIIPVETTVGKHLFALKVHRNGVQAWPAVLLSGSHAFARFMDNLCAPLPRNPITTIAIFDACAAAYESLINVDRNTQNIARLLVVIDDKSTKSGQLKVIDFGCGTGLSLSALKSLNKAERFEITGLDAAPHMQSIAKSRGMPLTTMHDTIAPQDGIFASYVLHGGTSFRDLQWIANTLAPGGLFVANWLHGQAAEINQLLSKLQQVRKGQVICQQESGIWNKDPILIFKTDENG
jgi:hypothetical protein